MVALIITRLLQVIGGTVAIGGGVIAAFKAIHEIRANRQQRIIEFRWKQVNAARELLTDIHKHELAVNAVRMLDWHRGKHEYELPDGSRVTISWEEILRALAQKQAACDSKVDTFVRDCFDWFFYFLDRIEHYTIAGLVERQDVEMVFKPYASIIQADRSVFWPFLEYHEYRLAMEFFDRYTTAASSPPSENPR